jgi:hypothetical protein
MKKILSSTTVLLAMMATPVFADFQEPPLPAPPVFKVDSTSTPQRVSVFSNGLVSSSDPILSINNNAVERFRMQPDGITTWSLGTPSHEAGKIMVSTPGGGLGIAMWPGMAPDWSSINTPRFDIDTWPALLNTVPQVRKYNTATSHIGFTITTSTDPITVPNNNTAIGITLDNFRTIINADGTTNSIPESNYIGINTLTPKARLEVKEGGIRINNASTTVRPKCDATTRGTFWVTSGDASKTPPVNSDYVSVCLWKKLGDGTDEYKWRTIVSSGNDEHVVGNNSHLESD